MGRESCLTSFTFRYGESQEGFTTLTKIGSCVAYVVVVDPDPVGFVSGRVTHLVGRQGANVSKASVGLTMPVTGFMKPDTFCIVSTLPDPVIEHTFMGGDVNVSVGITMSITHGSGFKA
jgi:hypothetical protein